MEEVTFKTTAFEGPLDLLLHLISKNKVSIMDIPIVEITDQYFSYINQWERENIEFSSEFIVMASTLLYIKSKMLLPRHEEEQEEEDPREALAQRLLEYQKYKACAKILGEEQFRSRYLFFKEAEKLNFGPGEVKNPNVPIEKLLNAFFAVLERKEAAKKPEVRDFDRVVGEKPVSVLSGAKKITRLLKRRGRVRFRELFENAQSRSETVATFLAVLEMLRANRMFVFEEEGELVCCDKDTEGEKTDEHTSDH